SLEAVVQPGCLSTPPDLILSADAIRESNRDLPMFTATGIDTSRLTKGHAAVANVNIDPGTHALSLTGISRDTRTSEPHDPSLGQGSLSGAAACNAVATRDARRVIASKRAVKRKRARARRGR